MSFPRSLCARFGLSKVSRPLARKRRAFLGLEQLEDRCVPATFNVNTLADSDAVSLVTGQIDTLGHISLRSALEAANAQSAGSTINLTVAGTYAAVKGHTGTDQSTAGAFTILPSSGGLTITNTSGGAVLVDGSGSDRVFDINPADHLITSQVTMSGFTIQDGAAPPVMGAAGSAVGSGGGIRDQGPVSLTLTNMVVTNNAATTDGGGIAMENTTSQDWTLTINNSTISMNSAAIAGGGVETDGSGQVNMSGDLIDRNKAQKQGGGIWLDDIVPPPGSVQSTLVTAGGSGYSGNPDFIFSDPGNGGTTGFGTANVFSGAIRSLNITNAGTNYTTAPTITFSTGPAAGSGLAATATASIVNNPGSPEPVTSVTVTSDGFNYTQAPMVVFVPASSDPSGSGAAATATIDAAGQVTSVAVTAGGSYLTPPTVEFVPTGSGASAISFLMSQSATLALTKSVVSNNEALSTGAIGGGIGTAGNGAVTVTSSTLTTDSAAGSGGGFGDAGGQSNITFVNDTFVIDSAGIDGGGFYAFGKSLVTLDNNTFTSNTAQVSGGGIFVPPYVNPIALNNDIVAGNGPNNGAGVLNIVVTNEGSGYTSSPTVTLTNAAGDTTGTGATANVVWIPLGFGAYQLLGVPGNSGSGYTLPPTVTITGGGGTGAMATALLTPTFPDIAAPVVSPYGDVIGIDNNSLAGDSFNTLDSFGTLANPINPMLGPLQNNGGATPTEAPLPGSPVINAGDIFDAGANLTTDPITGAALTDQRGGLRVVGSNVDAGAVEFQPGSTSIALAGSVSTSTFGAPVTFTAQVGPTAAAPNNPVTGTVTLMVGSMTVGMGMLDASGKATIMTTTLPTGDYFVTATYNPDTNAQEIGFTSIMTTGVQIMVNSVPTAPAFTSATTATFTIGTAGSFTVATTGDRPPTLTHSGNLPAGLSFSSATGSLILSGTPAAGTAGTYPITFTASNSVGSATQDFTLTVVASGGNPPPANAADELGAYRASNGSWSLDSDGTSGFNAATDQVFFSFSPANVIGVAGDWTGSGTSKVGDFSNGTWHLDLNNNGVLDPGETFTFGQAGDQPVVGDWTGSGVSNIGVFRTAPDGITGEFILDTNGDHIMDAGDETFTFGLGTDRIVIGDWNGGGKDEVGVFRDAVSFIPADVGDAVFSLDTNNNHTFDAGDQVFVFGLITDKVVIGDWNGSGTSKVGVYRDGSTASGSFSSLDAPGTALFSLDTNGDRQFDSGDQVFLYGLTTDQFVTGHWAKTPPVQPEGTPQAQFAANGPGLGGVTPLTEAQLEPVLQQAISNWEAHGASAAQLESVPVQIGQLNNNFVGLTSGDQITLDATADGWGWNTNTSSVTAGKMDLLTVVEHELGHELGLNDLDPASHPNDLMAATLPTGTRRTIGG